MIDAVALVVLGVMLVTWLVRRSWEKHELRDLPPANERLPLAIEPPRRLP